MEKIKCVAIDDDPLFLDILKFYCRKLDYVDLLATYENPIEGAVGVVKLKPDLLFLDIEMPYLNGFETVSALDLKPKIIVISSHTEYDLDLLKFDVAKFVTKPLGGIREFDSILKEVVSVYS
ncbi:MAG: response regulator [Cyclobacteriaceae bacterium]